MVKLRICLIFIFTSLFIIVGCFIYHNIVNEYKTDNNSVINKIETAITNKDLSSVCDNSIYDLTLEEKTDNQKNLLNMILESATVNYDSASSSYYATFSVIDSDDFEDVLSTDSELLNDYNKLSADSSKLEDYLYGYLVNYYSLCDKKEIKEVLNVTNDNELSDDLFISNLFNNSVTGIESKFNEEISAYNNSDSTSSSVLTIDKLSKLSSNDILLLDYGSKSRIMIKIDKLLYNSDALEALSELSKTNSSISVNKDSEIVYLEYTVTNITSGKIPYSNSFYLCNSSLQYYTYDGATIVGLTDSSEIESTKSQVFKVALIGDSSDSHLCWYNSKTNNCILIE